MCIRAPLGISAAVHIHAPKAWVSHSSNPPTASICAVVLYFAMVVTWMVSRPARYSGGTIGSRRI